MRKGCEKLIGTGLRSLTVPIQIQPQRQLGEGHFYPDNTGDRLSTTSPRPAAFSESSQGPYRTEKEHEARHRAAKRSSATPFSNKVLLSVIGLMHVLESVHYAERAPWTRRLNVGERIK